MVVFPILLQLMEVAKMEKRERIFVLSEEAYEIHRKFWEGKDPEIMRKTMGKTCPMLTIFLIDAHRSEGLRYIYEEIIKKMKEEGILFPGWKRKKKMRLSKERVNVLLVSGIDEFIPKILKDRKWIYEIGLSLIDKYWNSLKVEKEMRSREESDYIEDEDGQRFQHPEIEVVDVVEKINDYLFVKELPQKAGLCERQEEIYRHKFDGLTEEEIGKELGKARITVSRDIAKIRAKVRKVIQEAK